MQTQMKWFDLSFGKSPTECRAVASKTGHRSKASMDAQTDGFMQVMGALLSLPPEQLAQSLAGMKAGTVNEEADAFASIFGLDGKAPETTQLLQAFLQFNGVDKEKSPKGEGVQETQTLMGQLQSLLAANAALQTENPPVQSGLAPAAIDSEDEKVTEWKSKWQQFWYQMRLNLQGGQADAGALSAEAGDTTQALDAAVLKTMHRQAGEMIGESEMALKDEGVPDSKPEARSPLKLAGINPAHGGIGQDKTGAGQNAQAKNDFLPNSPLQNLAAGSSAASEQQPDSSQVQTETRGSDGKSSDHGHTAIPNAADVDVQSLVKPADANPSPQNPLSGPDLKSIQGAEVLSAKKEALPAEKQMQDDVIRQIVQRISMHSQGDQSKMVIRLKPEFLGNVHMQVLTENHQVSVHMTADSASVKQIIEQNLQHLRLELQHHGLEIQKFDVFVGNTNQERESGQGRAAFSQTSRQRQQRSSKNRTIATHVAGFDAVETRNSLDQADPNEIDYFA
jgi:flagellar hook-length control protein FliK